MDIYKQMYLYLFNRITDSLRAFEDGKMCEAAEILRSAQLTCEEMYIDCHESP